MKNNKGQALVEFVLIMPIFILMIISFIDLGYLYLEKIDLNNDLNYIEQLYKNNKEDKIREYVDKEKINYNIKISDSGTEISLNKKANVNSPIIKNIVKDVSVKKNIYP